ncbi:hypothetical protein [Sediminibacterium sp.]|uniref:hypothetical protein n=1 Tax=Sediminibacterium sp. TaxID=1917865 RepID=UPI003F6E89F6
MNNLIAYIPIFTTLFSIYFFQEIYRHYQLKGKNYLLWWTVGVLTFGLGTLSESINILFGWSEANVRYWYIVGALLGGYPLAQGSVYLLLNKQFAHITTFFFMLLIVVASYFVVLTPIELPKSFNYKLTGSVFAWKWVRYFSPLINIYAFLFLVGGAIYSAHKYYKQGIKEAPFRGNIFIAIGGLLPGIGGSFTRAGYVEVLYVTEFIGLVCIYYGYKIIKENKAYLKVGTANT